MRALPAAALLAILLGWSPHDAGAKQDDPRLDGLFDRLKAAASPAEAAPVEAQIWALWSDPCDSAAAALLSRAEAATAQRDYTEALGSLDALVAQAPQFAEGWNKRATVRYMIKDYKGSVEDIRRTLALEPRHFGALSGLGLVYLSIDDAPAAARCFEAALAIDPQLTGAKAHLDMLKGERDGTPL